MTKIEELRILNDVMIDALKSKGEDYKIYSIINDILKDDDCFSKITKEEAFIILENLNIKDEQKELIYKELKEKK